MQPESTFQVPMQKTIMADMQNRRMELCVESRFSERQNRNKWAYFAKKQTNKQKGNNWDSSYFLNLFA